MYMVLCACVDPVPALVEPLPLYIYRSHQPNDQMIPQVVVVTHTASVAALADQHLVVDKSTAGSRAADTSAGTDSSSGGGGGGGLAYAAVDAAPPPLTATAAGVDEDKVSPSPWRSRRHGANDGGLTVVSIREVQGRDREEEVARMAAGDMGGGAAAELAREMLRYSRRQA